MTSKPRLDAPFAERLAALALDGVAREYPNKLSLHLFSDDDLAPPRALTPAFYGCFDWHSAVHSHWTLARLARRFPDAPFADACRARLTHALTPENIAAELHYITPRAGFERPYGLGWLLALDAELQGGFPREAEALAPLTALAADRLEAWVERLPYPIRTGEHSQSALAMTLALDWSKVAGDTHFTASLTTRALDFHARDRAAPLHFEPSGHDFLSPTLATADLMRRVLSRDDFLTWFDAFLPHFDPDALAPAACPDPSDGKLAHLDGLNLSRAWMLSGIAESLPISRRSALFACAQRHLMRSLPAVRETFYTGAHWLGTFAAFALTGPTTARL